MTVSELIESLKELPGDMEIMVMNPDREDPVDITLVSRGRWGVDPEDDGYEERFLQDDEAGTTAVLVTW
jgi:hypothetical protein